MRAYGTDQKPHIGETVAIRELAPLLAGRIVVKWGTVPATDDSAVATPAIAEKGSDLLMIFLGFAQEHQQGDGQRNQTVAFFGFRVADEVAFLGGVFAGAGNIDGALGKIDIFKAQAADFTQAQAAGKGEQDGGAEGHIFFIG